MGIFFQCKFESFCEKEKQLIINKCPGCRNCYLQNINKYTINRIEFTKKEKQLLEEEIRNSISLNQNSQSQSNRRTKYDTEISISNELFIKELKDSPVKKYKILKFLGEGSYGEVFLAENIYTKKQVAIKKIIKNFDDFLTDKEIMEEIEILKSLEHPNIVKIYEFYNTHNFYYIIMEYCNGGELLKIINNQYSETEIAIIFKQILSCLVYLHSCNIIHRDLKLENFLISDTEISNNDEKLFEIKLIDFGTAKIFDPNKKNNTIVGSSLYIAPEVLDKKYGKECDLWSAGVILYIFIVGHAPFEGKNDKKIMEKVKNGKYKISEKRWINSSKEVRDLITKLLVVDPKNRLNAIQAINHPWFNKININILYENIPKNDIIYYIKNLLSYKIKTKFQELVWAYIIHNIPRPKEAKNAIKLFKLSNKNGDGKLTREELKKTLLNFVTEEFLENFDDIFSLLDIDNKGYISYEEFLRACLDKNKIINEEILKYAFNFFDGDNSGFISKNKIKCIFMKRKLTEDQFMDIFNEIDISKDDKIDFEKFKEMMLY